VPDRFKTGNLNLRCSFGVRRLSCDALQRLATRSGLASMHRESAVSGRPSVKRQPLCENPRSAHENSPNRSRIALQGAVPMHLGRFVASAFGGKLGNVESRLIASPSCRRSFRLNPNATNIKYWPPATRQQNKGSPCAGDGHRCIRRSRAGPNCHLFKA